MGADAIFNLLERSDTLTLPEGLSVFRMKIPRSLVGKTIANSSIRKNTGCTVISVNGTTPDPNKPLSKTAEIVLIGSTEGKSDSWMCTSMRERGIDE